MTNANDIEAGYERTRTGSTPLRVYRVARGLTQAELAGLAGISRITVGGVERGRHAPQLATARALAEALDCQISDLFPPEPSD